MILDGNKISENKLLQKLAILTLKDFMKHYFLGDDTVNQNHIQRVYKHPIYPRDSKIYSDKGFTNIDDGSNGGTHWFCFFIKDNKSI